MLPLYERNKEATQWERCFHRSFFKSLQIRPPWDKCACQSNLSRFQFTFYTSSSTCAALYRLRGMWSPDATWCICAFKGKTLTGMSWRQDVGTAGSMFQTCVHELIGAAQTWRGGGLSLWYRQYYVTTGNMQQSAVLHRISLSDTTSPTFFFF